MTVIVILCLVLSLTILFLAGPRVPVDLHIRPIELPADLEGYLKASEARFPDIVAHTEKTIIWADPATKRPTPLALVYLHGFSATRQETAPLAERVAQRLGANLLYTRLTGHGRPASAMGAATVNDWLNDGAEALAIGKRLGERVLLIATSTGGTLATWLASYSRSDALRACILISPNFMPAKAEARLLTLPWAKYLIPLFYGKIWRWTPINELHGTYWTQDYPMTANITLMGLVQFVKTLDVRQIRCPVLTFLSPHDEIVNPAATETMLTRFGSVIKKTVYIGDAQDPRQHVLAGDILSPNTTETMAQMIADFVAVDVGRYSNRK